MKAFMGNEFHLPCKEKKCEGNVSRLSVGTPRVVVSLTCQYYILPSLLTCSKCDKKWQSCNDEYMQILPENLRDICPAFCDSKKIVDRSVISELRRPGTSPSVVESQIKQFLQEKYERSHSAYLSYVAMCMKGDSDRCALVKHFGQYEDQEGYNGVSISDDYLSKLLVSIEYPKQEPYLQALMKGVYGNYLCVDHTRKTAKPVQAQAGVKWSLTVKNEYNENVSWVMVDDDKGATLAEMYRGLSSRYEKSKVEKPKICWLDKWCCSAQAVGYPGKTARRDGSPTRSNSVDTRPIDAFDFENWLVPAKEEEVVCTTKDREKFRRNSSCRENFSPEIDERGDIFHVMQRFERACSSESHILYPAFASQLSDAFYIVDKSDLEKLRETRKMVGVPDWEHPPNAEVKRFCRRYVPLPEVLEERVTSVMRDYIDRRDPHTDERLFTKRMMKEFQCQIVHIRRGCLSDLDGAIYLEKGLVKYHNKEGAELMEWRAIRGTSMLEGYHAHQPNFVTGNQATGKRFQAQAFLGATQWNWNRARENRKMNIPSLFDPELIAKLNTLHKEVHGNHKYPDVHKLMNFRDTGEKFGLDYQASSEVKDEPSTSRVARKQKKKRDRSVEDPDAYGDQASDVVDRQSVTALFELDEQDQWLICKEEPFDHYVSHSEEAFVIEPSALASSTYSTSRPHPQYTKSARPFPHTFWSEFQKKETTRLLRHHQHKGTENPAEAIAKEIDDRCYQSSTSIAVNPAEVLLPTCPNHVDDYAIVLRKKREETNAMSNPVDWATQHQATSSRLKETKDIPLQLFQPSKSNMNEQESMDTSIVPGSNAAPLHIPVKRASKIDSAREELQIPKKRNCTWCKKTMAGPFHNNYTHPVSGEVGFSYCDIRMSENLGIPEIAGMTYNAFIRNKEYFDKAQTYRKKEIAEKNEAKTERERERQRTGHKKPGRKKKDGR